MDFGDESVWFISFFLSEWISPYDNNTTAPGGQNEDGDDAWIAINDLGGTVGGGSGGDGSSITSEDLAKISDRLDELEERIKKGSTVHAIVDWLPVYIHDETVRLPVNAIIMPTKGTYNAFSQTYTSECVVPKDSTNISPVLPAGCFILCDAESQLSVYCDPNSISVMTPATCNTSNIIADKYISQVAVASSWKPLFTLPSDATKSFYLINLTITMKGHDKGFSAGVNDLESGRIAIFSNFYPYTGGYVSALAQYANENFTKTFWLWGESGAHVYLSNRAQMSTNTYTSSESELTSISASYGKIG
jgi:hypothetical protein